MVSVMTRPDALLLDAGNTVVFLDKMAVAEVLAEIGHSHVTAERLAQSHAAANRRYDAFLEQGHGHDAGWAVFMGCWIELAGVPRSASDAAVGALRAAHDAYNLWRHVPAYVRPALSRVRDASIPLGLISNSEGKLMVLLERLDLAAYFDVIVDSGLEGVSKPDPEIFHRACTRLGVTPARCLYAGDIPGVDVEGARAAGMQGALIDALGLYPDYRRAPRFESLAALVDAL